MSGQCSFIKPDGSRCKGAATGGNGLCWNHDPANAEKRRRTASRAGRSKANGEVRAHKADVRSLIGRVESGELDRNNAAVMLQGYRTLQVFMELERRLRETEDLERRLEELEEAIEAGAGKEKRWGSRAG